MLCSYRENSNDTYIQKAHEEAVVDENESSRFTFHAAHAHQAMQTHHQTLVCYTKVTWLFASLLILCVAFGCIAGLSNTAYALDSSKNNSVSAENTTQLQASSAAANDESKTLTDSKATDAETNKSASAGDSQAHDSSNAGYESTTTHTNTTDTASNVTAPTTTTTTTTNTNPTNVVPTTQPTSLTTESNAARASSDIKSTGSKSADNAKNNTTNNNVTSVTPQTTTSTTSNAKVTETVKSEYVSIEEGTYIIENEYGTVLDVLGAGSANGTNVQAYTDNATGAQRFIVKAAGTDKNGNIQYEILAQDSGKALDVLANLSIDGTNVQIYSRNQTNAQRWYFKKSTTKGGWSMLPWDVKGASAKAGANVQQYSSNGSNAQKWNIEWHNGAFFFKSALGNYALSLSSLEAGANAQLDTYNTSSANQAFLLNHTSLTQASVSDLISVLDFYASGNELKTFKSLNGLSSSTIDAIWDALYGFWDIGTSVGFTLIDLTSGAGVTFNSDVAYYAACTVKAPYSIALSEYVPSSLGAYSDEIWCALDYSDNETYMSCFYNYGTWPLDNYNSIAHVENFTWQSWLASYSAEDLCRLWAVSQEYLLGSSGNAAWLRNVLSNNTAQMTRSAVAKYCVNTVYAKTGWTDTARTEGSLVMDGDHPYVCAIMSTTNIEHSYLLSNLADALYRAHRDLIV